MSSANAAHDIAIRQARLAVAAHRDALVIAQDAKSLRLDYLRDLLLKRLPDDSLLRQTMLLRLPPEDEARLLLDLKHSVAMTGDGRTYRLEEDSEHGRAELFETTVAEEMAAEVMRRAAVATVEGVAANRGGITGPVSSTESWAQAGFLFLAGAVFGAAGLAAIAIYLKKLVI